MSIKLILTALPNGINPDNKNLRISIALSLQVPDALPGATLSQYPDLMKWAELVNKASFKINNIEAKKTSKKADETLWQNLFTGSIKLQSFVQPDNTKIPILSYPVKHIVDFIKNVSQATGKAHFNDMPEAGYYTNNPLFASISNYNVGNEIPQRGRKEVTLSDIVTDGRKGELVRRYMREKPFIPFSGKAEPNLDFAQLNNFHGMYSAKPVDTFKQFEKPDFEFHEILSVLTQYPQLMRKLGLVVDVEIPNNAAAALNAVSALPNNLNFSTAAQIVFPTTAAELTATGFYARPDTGSIYDKGFVKINNEGFTVFQIDADGAALKITSQVDALMLKKARHILYASKNNVKDIKAIPLMNNELTHRREGLPSNRSAGITIAKNGLAEHLNKRFRRMNDLKASFTSATPPQGISNANASYSTSNTMFFADDVISGYRLDIRSSLQQDWHSVHHINNDYSYLNSSGASVAIPNTDTEEGFIQLSTTEDKNIEGPHMKLSEVIARWEGWSLAAPPTGKGMNEPMLSHEEMEKTDELEKKKFLTPKSLPFRLNVFPKVTKGSLPKLRFGETYSMKLRTVDLAGNSVNYKSLPENTSLCMVDNFRYLRYEPTDAPFLVYGNAVKDGESSEVMVIRSNEGEPVSSYEAKWPTKFKDTSIRHVKPPRSSVGFAVTHGALDNFIGKNADAANTIYDKIVPKKDPFTPSASSPADAVVIDGEANIKEVDYLADPMAAGAVFYLSPLDPNPKAAGYDDSKYYKRISFYSNTEATVDAVANADIDFEKWMNPMPFRIVFKEGKSEIAWDEFQRKLTVSLPKGVQAKFNYACYWRPKDVLKYSGMLAQLGYNNFVDEASKAMGAGRHWMISPWRVLTFVHAVQQPLSELAGSAEKLPLINEAKTDRNFGDTEAAMSLNLKLQGFSTGQADIEADWKDIEDDGITINEKGFVEIPHKQKVLHFPSVYGIHNYVFGDFPDKNIINNPFKALHHFNDTRHRWVNYKIIATTRYKENFFNLINEKKDAFVITRDGNTVSKVNVLSSARPLAPQVAYVIPTFEWDRITKGDTTLTARASGLRVYLKRPWYSSGEGEKLAVVLLPASNASAIMEMNTTLHERYATTWGFDPTKISGNIKGYIFPMKELFMGIKKGDANNLYTEDNLSIGELPNAKLNIVAYDVKFDAERNMYYADIMFNIGTTYFPFVKLSLAAYQQHSVRKNEKDCCLSPLVQPDYIQVPPPRASSIKQNGTDIAVAISGTLPEFPRGAQYANMVKFIIEPITVPSSESVHISTGNAIDSYEATINPADIKNFAFLHSHSFKLPAEYASKPYRVRILEYELITTDPGRTDPYVPNIPMAAPPPGQRLVFADVYEVNV